MILMAAAAIVSGTIQVKPRPMSYSAQVVPGSPYERLVTPYAIGVYAPGSKHAGYWFQVYPDGEVGIGVFNDLFDAAPDAIDAIRPGLAPPQMDAFRWAREVLAREGVKLQPRRPGLLTWEQLLAQHHAELKNEWFGGKEPFYDHALVDRYLEKYRLPPAKEY